MRQIKDPSLKADVEAYITCSSTSQTITSPLKYDAALRNFLGSNEFDQTTVQSFKRALHQSLSANSSVWPVFSRPSEACTEVSPSPRTASQLIAYPIRFILRP